MLPWSGWRAGSCWVRLGACGEFFWICFSDRATVRIRGDRTNTYQAYVDGALPLKSRWSLCLPPGLTFTNSAFCPHSAFMCFVWIWEQTAIISLYSINWLVFITETECVYCAVRTGSLYTASLAFSNSTFCHTVYLCVLCGSENRQRLFPYTALTDWFS